MNRLGARLMDPVDVLTMAVVAAQAIRSATHPEAVLLGGYQVLGREPPMDQDEAMAIRVARLMTEAGEKRRDVLAYLRAHAGPLFMNRSEGGWARATGAEEVPIEPEPEAVQLIQALDEGRLEGLSMFEFGFGPFEIATRSVVGWFQENLLLVAGRHPRTRWSDSGFVPEPGSIIEVNLDELPVTARGLIYYPMQVPVLFTIETGPSPWSLWDICCAFADQYGRIYEHP